MYLYLVVFLVGSQSGTRQVGCVNCWFSHYVDYNTCELARWFTGNLPASEYNQPVSIYDKHNTP